MELSGLKSKVGHYPPNIPWALSSPVYACQYHDAVEDISIYIFNVGLYIVPMI